MFVRYESNSILQLLYPCSRYAPNKCMICGGSYPDHLELWWSKHHLYSPFDQYLDKTYNDALMINDEKQRSSVTGWSHRNSFPSTTSSSTHHTITGTPSFAFHKHYVKDVSDIVDGIDDREEQIKSIKKKLKTRLRSDMNYRIKRLKPTGVTYIAPGVGTKPNEKNNRFTKKDTFIDILSSIALWRVDCVIFEQAIEFEYNKKRRSSVRAGITI